MPITKTTKAAPLYAVVLRDAWRFTWHHPVLWLLGFFALFIGHTGVFEIIGFVANELSGQTISAFSTGPIGSVIIPTIFGSQLLGLGGVGMMLAIRILIAIMIVVAAVASSAALIHAARKHYEDDLESVQRSWHHGIRHFWPVFFLNVFKKSWIFATVWLLRIPLGQLLREEGSGWFTALFVTEFVVAILLALTVSFVVNYASMYIILEEEHLGRSIADGWATLRKHWLVSFEMGALLLMIQAAVGVLTVYSFYFIFGSFAGLTMAAQMLNAPGLVATGFLVHVFMWFAFVSWVGSVFTAFAISAWTILYTHFRKNKSAVGFLRRMFHLAFHA
jgi:hypothetical protein